MNQRHFFGGLRGAALAALAVLLGGCWQSDGVALNPASAFVDPPAGAEGVWDRATQQEPRVLKAVHRGKVLALQTQGADGKWSDAFAVSFTPLRPGVFVAQVVTSKVREVNYMLVSVQGKTASSAEMVCTDDVRRAYASSVLGTKCFFTSYERLQGAFEFVARQLEAGADRRLYLQPPESWTRR